MSDGKAPSLEFGDMVYSFITITLSSTLFQSGSTYKGPIYGSSRTVESFTKDYFIIIGYLEPYNCVQIVCIR